MEMSQAFFRAVAECGANIIIAHTKEHEIIYASSTVRSVGYAPEDLIGNTVQPFIHREDWRRVDAVIAECMETPNTPASVGDIRARSKGGDWFWLHGQYIFFVGLEGEDLLVFVGANVTDRKKAEIKAMELQAAVEQSMEGIAVADMDGVLTFANTAWARMHGYEVKELQGKNLSIFHTPDQMRLDVLPFINKTLEAGSFRGEVGHVRKDGTTFPAWHSGGMLKNESGEATAIMAVIYDITARKNAEIELKKREIMYRTLVEQSLQGVGIIRNDPVKVVYCNPALEEMVGRTAKELRALSTQELVELVHPNDYPELAARFLDRLAGKKVDPHQIVRVFKKDGTLMWLETVCQLIPHEGSPATLGLCRDITDRRRLEENLRQTRKMEAIGTLAGGIAHNLNNILYPIMGYTEMAVDDIPEDSAAAQNLQEVLIAINRAKDLVHQILAFAHKSKEQQAATELGPIVHEVVRLMRGTLPATIKITQDISNEAPAVMADPSQAHQALVNLCTNAFHAMRDKGGELEVSLEEAFLRPEQVPDFALPPGRYSKISVRDTGAGIDPMIMDRIFEPYFTTREVGDGTGMGLSEAHAFARNCGGDIRAVSTPGKGSLFEIYLPAIEQMRSKAMDAAPAAKDNETILLAENDPQIRKMNTQVLTRLGYSVHAAANGKEALDALANTPGKFDLIITELHMPIMTGAQLARDAKALQPDLPVVLCTGFAEALTRREAQDMGVDGVIKKPMRKKDVAQVVRSVLDAR
ncbi:PAS domain S-box-containing protein [Desulfatibacillum alkenivorans DSM 16219]|jgi:PAS domain S-box-containing protein|uniref:histidine kinase n=1 Tax=Desulfatibacillum alkenivorans DSM 16219 TaxID=1121393 RepID=A0A1M6U620_9BACT|nr:PAS domain-containing sensor histidine kinase [Desulfatibacillum alkenivorans]SHK64702.1 PAS domain S-box-containing protein [Desulfatibacillum alkenivorans DSM 16219]